MDIERAVASYKSGTSLLELGREFRRAPVTIRAALIEHGVKIRRPGGDCGQRKNWRGGRRIDGDGYVWIHFTEVEEEFLCMCVGRPLYVAEHRLVMARRLGRPLRRDEQVHHIDGDRARNVIENLQLRFGAHGSGVALCCADCGSMNIQAGDL